MPNGLIFSKISQSSSLRNILSLFISRPDRAKNKLYLLLSCPILEVHMPFVKSLLVLVLFAPFLSAAPVIHSASELDYPPFSVVEKDGSAGGFSVDLLQATLASMGRDVDFYVGPWNAVRTALEEGKIDVLPLVGRTPEREAYFDFTFPYLTMHGAIFVRTGTKEIQTRADLRNRTILVMRGDNAEEFVRREKLSDNIVTTKDYTEAFTLLASGKYDAVIAQKLIGLNIIKHQGITNVHQVGDALDGFKQSFSFAVKEGDKELLAILNEGLSYVMADGTFHALQEKWFAGLNPEKADMRYLVTLGIAVLVLLAALVTVLLWQRILSKQVEQRTRELKKSKEELKKSQELFYTLFNNMNIGSVVYTPFNDGEDFIISDINLRGEEISSVRKAEIIGKKVTEVFPGIKKLGLFEIFREVYRSGEPQSQQNSLYEDGRIAIWVENFVYKLPSGDIVAIYNDRTLEKSALAELEALNKSLKKKIEAAIAQAKEQEKMLLQQSRFTAMGEMMGAIAHQWRQPLNSVGLIVQDIKEAYEFGELDATYIDTMIAKAMEQINSLSKIIDDFRTFFLPNKEKEHFSACDIVDKALSLLATQMKYHQIEVRHLCEDDFQLYGYPNELKQALINIISNAKDAILKSQNADRGMVEIRTYIENNARHIAIRDNGGGIAETIVDKLYDPYFTTKFTSQGTGIGLYMTKAIIEQSMGGTLGFFNTPDGACFVTSFKNSGAI
jgi:ABC-type amino acid transport substrate-binding protein/signal transduction histidine kinase